jgi:hypothetical protein
MEERFGHTSMKERYMAEAKLRKRQAGESLRDFGQALEDLYRRRDRQGSWITCSLRVPYFHPDSISLRLNPFGL